jgi:hypothetical protein
LSGGNKGTKTYTIKNTGAKTIRTDQVLHSYFDLGGNINNGSYEVEYPYDFNFSSGKSNITNSGRNVLYDSGLTGGNKSWVQPTTAYMNANGTYANSLIIRAAKGGTGRAVLCEASISPDPSHNPTGMDTYDPYQAIYVDSTGGATGNQEIIPETNIPLDIPAGGQATIVRAYTFSNNDISFQVPEPSGIALLLAAVAGLALVTYR